jgi:ribonuclease D
VSWIDTQDALAEVLPELRAAGEIAIDTEADSYYVYRVKVCLLQVSTRSGDYLIDPLRGLDLSPIGELCADPRVLKVFHAGANDVALLRHHHDFAFTNLFDTMLAAQVLGLKRPGLAALLKERFDVEQKKTYQTSDWGQRPLTDGQLQYAAADTRYLLELKDQLRRELVEKSRFEEALEDFERLRTAEHAERVYDPDAFRRAPGAHAFGPVEMRVLQELYLLRDRIAARRDRSPHRIFPDHALAALAHAQPATRDELQLIRGLPRWQLERDERELLQTIATARAKGPLVRERRAPRGPNGELPLGEEDKRVFEALRQWRRTRASAREVEESRVATTGTLRLIARERTITPASLRGIPGMSPFRVREYGDEILKVVAEARQPG